jgi:hypothetical protein
MNRRLLRRKKSAEFAEDRQKKGEYPEKAASTEISSFSSMYMRSA